METPHKVTFLSRGSEPELVLVEPQQRGPPKFVPNPAVQMPASCKAYSGNGTSILVRYGHDVAVTRTARIQSCV